MVANSLCQLGDLPFRVLGALEKDIYRKPNTGMFDFVAKLYKDKGWEIGASNPLQIAMLIR